MKNINSKTADSDIKIVCLWGFKERAGRGREEAKERKGRSRREKERSDKESERQSSIEINWENVFPIQAARIKNSKIDKYG
jgi:hypothetical protein